MRASLPDRYVATARTHVSYRVRSGRVSLRVSSCRICLGRPLPCPLVVDELGRGGLTVDRGGGGVAVVDGLRLSYSLRYLMT